MKYRVQDRNYRAPSQLLGAVASELAKFFCTNSEELPPCSDEQREIHTRLKYVSIATSLLEFRKVFLKLFFSRVSLLKEGVILPLKFFDISNVEKSVVVSVNLYSSHSLYQAMLTPLYTLEPIRITKVSPQLFQTFKSTLAYEKNFRSLESKLLGSSTPFYQNLPFICLQYDKKYRTLLIFHRENQPAEASLVEIVQAEVCPPEPEPTPTTLSEELPWLFLPQNQKAI